MDNQYEYSVSARVSKRDGSRHKENQAVSGLSNYLKSLWHKVQIWLEKTDTLPTFCFEYAPDC
jgi:hypothetical protein